jgi:hypothetical protein
VPLAEYEAAGDAGRRLDDEALALVPQRPLEVLEVWRDLSLADAELLAQLARGARRRASQERVQLLAQR